MGVRYGLVLLVRSVSKNSLGVLEKTNLQYRKPQRKSLALVFQGVDREEAWKLSHRHISL